MDEANETNQILSVYQKVLQPRTFRVDEENI